MLRFIYSVLILFSCSLLAQKTQVLEKKTSLKLPKVDLSTLKLETDEEKVNTNIDIELFIKKNFKDFNAKTVNLNGEPLTIISLKKRGGFGLTEKYYCAETGEPVIPNLNFGDIAAFSSILTLNTVTAKIYLDRNHTPRSDKLLHFTTGYNIGSFGTGLAQLILPKKMKRRRLIAFLAGSGLAILSGIAKEVKDSDGSGNVELLDALATSAGGVTGAAIFSLTDVQRIFSKNKRKKIKENSYELSDLERLELELAAKELQKIKNVPSN